TDMALKILCAGGSKEEKEAAEAAVRAGIGPRPAAEAWTVSLVKVGRQWSVTLDGPEKSSPRSTFIAGEGRLRDTISQSLAHRGPDGLPDSAARPQAPTRRPTAASAPRRQRRNAHQCPSSGTGLVVVHVEDAGGGAVAAA